MSAVLSLRAATKTYGTKTAVADLDVGIEAGERVAVLGRNGAGKTTLLRMVLGLTRPTGGTCRLFGRSADDREALGRVGYAPQATSVPSRLRVGEIVRFVCQAKGAPEPAALLDRLSLRPLWHRQAGGLSLGQRRRLTLLLAFVGDPELVVLDEPTASLDSESRQVAWEMVREFCRDGGTLLLASHDFGEVAALATRVLVLAAGRLRADAGVEELARTSGVTALEIPRTDRLSLSDLAPAGVSHVLHTADRTILVTRRPDEAIAQLRPLAPDEPVVRRRPTVEEVCLALHGGGR